MADSANTGDRPPVVEAGSDAAGSVGRRALLGTLGAAASGLAGCPGGDGTATRRPEESCDWKPNALEPVFYGRRDYDEAAGVPGPVRVFFPSLGGSPTDADVLADCGGYPLVLFAHGQCEADEEPHTFWRKLPATLARAGHVVALPRLSHDVPPPRNDAAVEHVAEVAGWLRDAWSHRDVLVPLTGVAGHSWGALLAGRFAREHDAAALASLAGPWGDDSEGLARMRESTRPKFFAQGTADKEARPIAPADWESLGVPKHRATFDRGNHWDFLPSETSECEGDRGPCSLTPGLAVDLTVMFFGRTLGLLTPLRKADIPPSLVPPALKSDDADERRLAGAYLQGFPFLGGASDCSVTLTWDTPTDAGTTTVPE